MPNCCKENALVAREGRLHEQEKQLKANQEAAAAMRVDLEERAELFERRGRKTGLFNIVHIEP